MGACLSVVTPCWVLFCSSACECHENGTLTCDSTNGRCFCRANVEGELCDRCRDPFWGLQLGLPEGCIPCDCCDRTASAGCNQVSSSKPAYRPPSGRCTLDHTLFSVVYFVPMSMREMAPAALFTFMCVYSDLHSLIRCAPSAAPPCFFSQHSSQVDVTVCPTLVLRQTTSAATALLASLASPWGQAVKVCISGHWPGVVCVLYAFMLIVVLKSGLIAG